MPQIASEFSSSVKYPNINNSSELYNYTIMHTIIIGYYLCDPVGYIFSLNLEVLLEFNPREI